MLNSRRVWIATISGFVLGIPDWYLAVPGVIPFIPVPADAPLGTWPAALTVISIRTMSGFVIGISALRMAWWWHGIVVSLIAGFPLFFVCGWAGLGWTLSFLGVNGAGIVIGLLIEWVTSVLFKAPAGKP